MLKRKPPATGKSKQACIDQSIKLTFDIITTKWSAGLQDRGGAQMVAASKLSALVPVDGHRTLGERAVATLHEAILTGVLAPGERLPIEDLAQTLDMSPMPIREALRLLGSIGLVENVPHRGARVTELSVDDLKDVYESRLALEPLTVRRAALRFTPEDAARARERLDAHVEAYGREDLRLIWSTHTAFHFAIYDAAGSRWMTRLIRPLWDTTDRYRFAMLPMRTSLDTRRVEHEAILAACVEQEPGLAAVLVHNHLATTANMIAFQMGVDPLFELAEEPASSRAK